MTVAGTKLDIATTKSLYILDAGSDGNGYFQWLFSVYEAPLDEVILLNGDLTNEDLSAISRLSNLNTLALEDINISDLSFLKNLTNLTFLGLISEQIDDITPLAGLKKLVKIQMIAGSIKDISPLAELVNLNELKIFYNKISFEDIEWLKNKLPNCFVYIFK